MAGTKEGAAKAVQTIKATRPDFYCEIGRIGGRNGNTGGFYDRDLARRAGALGGRVSRRKPKVNE